MLTIVSVIIFSLILIGIGVYSNSISDDTQEDFFLGGRSIGVFATVMTLVFSVWSTLAFYGVVGEAYTNGIGSLGIAQGIFWGAGIQTFVGYRLWTMGKNYNMSTPGNFFSERFYSKFFGLITSVILIIFTMPYIGMQLAGLGSGLEGATGIPAIYGTVGLAFVLLLFVSLGGMRSVAWTDAVQGVVFTVVVIVSLFALLIFMPDTLPNVMNKAMEARPGLNGIPGPNNLYSPFLSLHLAISIGSFAVWPHIFVRFFIAKSKETYKVLSVAFPIYEVIAMVPLTLIGIMVIPYLFGGDLNPLEAQMSIHAAMETIPYGNVLGTGIFLAAFGAAMSTASSQLLACSSMFIEDIFNKYTTKELPEKRIVMISRLVTVFFVVISTFLGIIFPNVFDTATKIATPGYAQLLPALIAGLFWRRATKEGAIVGTLVGFATFILTTWVWTNPLGVTGLIWSMLVNTTLLVVVSLLTPPPSDEVIYKYHDAIEEELFGVAEQN